MNSHVYLLLTHHFLDVQQYSVQSETVFTNISKIVGPWTAGGPSHLQFAPPSFCFCIICVLNCYVIDDGESILDVELLTGVGSGVANWYWTIGDGWAYEMALELFNATNPNIVVSVSYGWPEVHRRLTFVFS